MLCSNQSLPTGNPWGLGHKFHVVMHWLSCGWCYAKMEKLHKDLVGIRKGGKGSAQQETKGRLIRRETKWQANR